MPASSDEIIMANTEMTIDGGVLRCAFANYFDMDGRFQTSANCNLHVETCYILVSSKRHLRSYVRGNRMPLINHHDVTI
jgi:hypothetical protein